MQEEKKLTGYPSIDKPWLKYYSEEAIHAPLPECTIYEYLWESNKDHLGSVALNYFGRKITFETLFSNIERTASAFSSIGVKAGDIVFLATVTTPETIYALYALNRLGAIANMVDPRTSVEGINEYVYESNSKVVISLDIAYSKIEKAIQGTDVQTVIILSPADSLPPIKKRLYQLTKKPPKINLSSNFLRFTWDSFLDAGTNILPRYSPYIKDTCCVIVHTGGTTGTPKGVMLSNDNLNALVYQSILTGIDMRREHTWMDIMPPFIAYGIGMGICLPLVIGMETILIPSFDARKFDKLILKHQPNHMVFVPSYWGTIIDSRKLKHKDLSFIIAPTVGGDSLQPELEKKANEFLRNHGCVYPVTKGYGMTEICAGVTGTLDKNNEIGSVGVPFVKSVVAIFDPTTGEELSYGEKGEICISGPNTMLGYYENEAATAQVIRLHADGSKWVHSGDIGYMNESGSLFVVDRMKRMLVRYDGFKVFPSLIESVISKHNYVTACCVVGIQDRRHSQGKLPIAFVVLDERTKTTVVEIEKQLLQLCSTSLPEYAQPSAIHLLQEIPLTGVGKVDYRALETEAEKLAL